MRSGARATAATIVGRVLRAGGYSNVLVSHAPAAEASTVRALVFDVLKHLESIDRALARAARRPVEEIDDDVLDVIRVATAEMARGDRPAAVTVDAAVDAVKAFRPKAAGFANAVLRRVEPPDLDRPVELPDWVHTRLAAAWGEEEAARFAAASAGRPAVGVRVRPGDTAPPESRPVPGIPEAVLVERPPPGAVIQDPASVAVVEAAAPRPGDRVLEIGAAPGGKTAHLVDLAGERVVALDAHPRRARTGSRRVPEAAWVVGDGRRPPFADASFDVVLVDAPCSGLGTLRRRPEVRLRMTEDEVGRLAELQRSLVDAAIGLVRPGGRLVYSVCTVMPEETVEVVAGRGSPVPGLPGRVWGDGTLMAPHLGGIDGMYVSVIAC